MKTWALESGTSVLASVFENSYREDSSQLTLSSLTMCTLMI